MNSFYSSHNNFSWSVHLLEHITIKQIYALEAGMKVLFWRLIIATFIC